MQEINPPLDVIVVGAGHAGLCASYYLKRFGIKHLVLEQGRVGESWLSQRWEGFRMNTANKLNTLPGGKSPRGKEDRFGSAKSLSANMKEFVATNDLPLRTNARVISVNQQYDFNLFQVETVTDGMPESFICRKVIIASGAQNVKQISPFEPKISSDVKQLHSSEYRNPEQLPPGDILIVGSGQSACQIAEELNEAGRKVYLSTSKVPRCPRRYRGKDVMDWLITNGFFNTIPEEIRDPAWLDIRTPLLKGTHGGNKTLSLQALASQGVMLLGRLKEANEYSLHFQADVLENVAFADAFSEKVKAMIDMFIKDKQLDAPLAEVDSEDEPDKMLELYDPILTLELNRQNITTIIWANGFRAYFNYIKLPIFDSAGNVAHKHGISKIEGLYFLGLHWLRSRKSNILFGIKDDAQFIIEHILSSLRKISDKDI